MYLGWFAHVAFDADARLNALAFWRVLVFGLETMLLVLLGLQVPTLAEELQAELTLADLTGAALLVTATVTALRLAAQFVPFAFPAAAGASGSSSAGAGCAGAISLAAALAVPLSVDTRPEIVYLTSVVLLVTLVGQGLTLPALLRALGMRGERAWSPDEAIARLEAAQAALDRIDELEDEGADEEVLRRLRELYRARFRACQAVLGGDGDGHPPADPRPQRCGDLRRDLIVVERDTLLRLRNSGQVRNEVMRAIERDLDLDQARLRT